MAAHSHVVVPTWVGLLLTAAMMLGSWALTYHNADKQTAVDIATLKVQQANTADEVQKIDTKVDKLLGWALGDKQ
jgi:hypothetical protein